MMMITHSERSRFFLDVQDRQCTIITKNADRGCATSRSGISQPYTVPTLYCCHGAPMSKWLSTSVSSQQLRPTLQPETSTFCRQEYLGPFHLCCRPSKSQVAENFALRAATASYNLWFTAPLLAAEHFRLLTVRCGTACHRRLRWHRLWRPSALDSRRSSSRNHILTFGWSDILFLHIVYSGPSSVLNT